MKKILIFALVVLALGYYSYFEIIKKEQEAAAPIDRVLPENGLERLVRFTITSEDYEIQIQKEKGVWWLTKPRRYPANQEYVEKSLLIMHETRVTNSFEFGEDRFGMNPGKAFMHLEYDDSLQKRLKVGRQSAPADHIYVLDADSNKVFVMHNLWAQFLYFPAQRFYHPYLPIPGDSVKELSLKNKDSFQWKLSILDGNQAQVELGNKSVKISKPHLMWFFKKVREFELTALEFDKKESMKGAWVLQVKTKKGNIRFQFNDNMDKIYVPELNVFADVKPYSLKSLGYELKKVIESDKK